MKKEKILQLLTLLDELVNEDGLTWTDKKKSVLREVSEADRLNLSEFSGWFE